jgi:PAS domain S-box-containing protein
LETPAESEVVAAAGARARRRLWINYSVRSIAFGVAFLGIGLHAWERGFGPLLWAGLALQFLVYPHLLFLRARRAAHPVRAEFQHLYVDSFLLAAWVAVLGFPLWIAYALVFSTTLNAVANLGLRGLAYSIVCSCLGLLAGIVLTGLSYQPETSPVVTMLAFFGSIAYASSIGYLAYRHAERRAEAVKGMRESEERYRMITEHAGDLIAMVDTQARWIYASPSHRAILAPYDLEPGVSALRCVHVEDFPRVQEAFRAATAQGTPFSARLRLLGADGNVRALQMTGQPVRDASGSVARMVLVSRDVTELQRELERNEIAARAFERMSEAILICSAEGRVVMVNRAYSEITGYSAREVIGQPERDFRSALQPASFYDELYAEVNRSGKWSGTLWAKRRDGNLYREQRSVSAVRDDAGRITHYVTAFFDLTRPLAATAIA